MVKIPAFDTFQYLARRRFPLAYQQFTPMEGQFSRTRQRELYEVQAAAYIEELRAKPPEELRAMLSKEKAKEAEETAERLRSEEASRFFNRPEAWADFAHWSKAAFWTIEEAIALSFGRDPRAVSWATIEGHVRVSPFVMGYRDLRDLAGRAKHMGQLYDPVVPGIYLAWAARIGAKIDQRLIDGVVANGGIVADWKSMFDAEKEAHEATKALLTQQREELLSWAKEKYAEALEFGKSALVERETQIHELKNQILQVSSKSERPLSTRERNSLLTLVIGLAIKGFAYDPTASRSTVITEIVSDLNELGLSLDADTVRKYLNEAKELLPREETE